MSRNGYAIFLFGEQFPVTPSRIQMKIKGNNQTMNLINDGEINFLKLPGLTDISIDFLLPMRPGYPFAVYPQGFRRPDYYMGLIERHMVELKTTQLIVSRATSMGQSPFDTNIKVSVEDYDPIEDYKEGLDVILRVKLKKYKDFGTKRIVAKEGAGGQLEVMTETTREASSAPQVNAVKATAQDTPLSLARQYFGDGARAADIFAANMNVLPNPYQILAGTVMTLR